MRFHSPNAFSTRIVECLHTELFNRLIAHQIGRFCTSISTGRPCISTFSFNRNLSTSTDDKILVSPSNNVMNTWFSIRSWRSFEKMMVHLLCLNQWTAGMFSHSSTFRATLFQALRHRVPAELGRTMACNAPLFQSLLVSQESNGLTHSSPLKIRQRYGRLQEGTGHCLARAILFVMGPYTTFAPPARRSISKGIALSIRSRSEPRLRSMSDLVNESDSI